MNNVVLVLICVDDTNSQDSSFYLDDQAQQVKHFAKGAITDESNKYINTQEWDSTQYIYTVRSGENYFGIKSSQVSDDENVKYHYSIVSSSLANKVKEIREKIDLPIIIIGINNNPEIEYQVNSNLRECDVIFDKKDLNTIKAVRCLVTCVKSKGGLLHGKYISELINAGILVRGSTGDVSTASYDLCLGDDVWCQGEFIRLSESMHLLTIPAYSYAIVSAREIANLPSFISARFDLKNSLFFNGVILSNGPQVDPGYRGSLFCMLYNGSDTAVGIKRGEHFATIEFHTTMSMGTGYSDKYQDKYKLIDFIPTAAATSRGGQILERTEKKINDIESSWRNFRAILFTLLFGALALIVSPGIIVGYNVWDIADDFRKKEHEIDQLIVEISNLKIELEEYQKKNKEDETKLKVK